MKRRFQNFLLVWATSFVSLLPLVSPSHTNTFLWERIWLYMIVELGTKRKYSVPVTIIITDASAKDKEFAKAKAEYQQIYFNLANQFHNFN